MAHRRDDLGSVFDELHFCIFVLVIVWIGEMSVRRERAVQCHRVDGFGRVHRAASLGF